MKTRKIFDITPPGRTRLESPPRVFPSSRNRLIISLGLTAVLILAGTLSFIFIKPKAEIEIWPETEKVHFETATSLPGEIFQTEKTISEEFSATGTKIKQVKARGTIRVYNNYSVYSQPLVATTRFVSADGKLFRTSQRIVVPGGHYEGGKLAPGFIDIEVVADQPGQDYNIEPTTFSIPGFVGTAKYTAFYAKSFEAMSGGMESEVFQVSQQDLDRAKEVLIAKSLEEARLALESSINIDEYILLEAEESPYREVAEFKPLAEKGRETDKFTAQYQVQIKTLVLKRQSLREFARDYVFSQAPPDKKLREDSLRIEYLMENMDFSDEKISLKLEISAEIYSTIDEDSLKEMSKDKNPERVRGLLQDFPEIQKIKVRLWPFWARKIPQQEDKISIKLNLD